MKIRWRSVGELKMTPSSLIFAFCLVLLQFRENFARETFGYREQIFARADGNSNGWLDEFELQREYLRGQLPLTPGYASLAAHFNISCSPPVSVDSWIARLVYYYFCNEINIFEIVESLVSYCLMAKHGTWLGIRSHICCI